MRQLNATMQRFSSAILFATTALTMAALIVAGCENGPTRGEVRGKVTYKGQPVKEGTVTFLNPTEGGAAEATIGEGGAYEVAGGAVVGEYIVEIKPVTEMRDTDPGKSPPAPVEKNAPDIPKKYRMQGTTPLKAKVEAGKNEFNFEMN
jgi:hypothetical protein